MIPELIYHVMYGPNMGSLTSTIRHILHLSENDRTLSLRCFCFTGFCNDPSWGHKLAGLTVNSFFSFHLWTSWHWQKPVQLSFPLAGSMRHDNTLVFTERKSQGLQEPDHQILGGNAAVSTTGKHEKMFIIIHVLFSTHAEFSTLDYIQGQQLSINYKTYNILITCLLTL